MSIKPNNDKSIKIALTFTLILVVTIAFVLASCFSKSNIGLYPETIINQVQNQSSFPASVIGVNETMGLNATNSYFNQTSEPVTKDSVVPDILNSSFFKQPDQVRFLHSVPNSPYVPLTAVPSSLDESKFITYTYGCGYSVQQPDSNQFIFSFPDNTSYGQISGSDALTLNTFEIQKINFDATFNTPKISALGFDEMAIFATSDTNTYKGTEFGIRMDLKDGFIYGYVQEPNGNCGEVNFMMLELTLNDGLKHQYTLIVLGSEVSFWIDGIDYGFLNFPNNTDYAGLSFSIVAAVHRFTDDWDSIGDNMIMENFSLNYN